MAPFFVNRPIVAMVLSIVIVLTGLVAMLGLPIALFPNIAPPEISIQGTYTGADALTVEEAVAAPIEQQVTGVDNMIYMRSYNSSDGSMTLRVDFDVTTDPNTDLVNANIRLQNAMAQLPSSVQAQGLTIRKASSSPLLLISIYSPRKTYDQLFLANYAYINVADPLSRVYGVGQISVFGYGQYAMRIWVNPDQLAKLGITINEISTAIQNQNTANPSGQIGGEPAPAGQEFTYAVRALGRLVTEEDFGKIVVRANDDGSYVRVSDVARVELGSAAYNVSGRFNGEPSAILNIAQLPGTNAIQAAREIEKTMQALSERFPEDVAYKVSLDTTLAITAGIDEIVKTLFEALVLVVLVVFIFLQSWRATLIPLMTVPVALIGTFIFFIPLGFSINTLSLFGLVLAIGLVVDDAIVVVEAVEHHIAQGMTPREATLKAMEEVTGPVVAIALILAAVFVPTAFIPGITGRLYQQFAGAIAISVVLSAFNALTLSPALCSILLKPRKDSRGPLGRAFGAFNRGFDRTTNGYVRVSHFLIRKVLVTIILLVGIAAMAGLLGGRVPTGFVPDEDQGYLFMNVQLPTSASLQRTQEVFTKVEDTVKKMPGVDMVTSVMGFSMLTQTRATYSGFLAVVLKPWEERPGLLLEAKTIAKQINVEFAHFPDAQVVAFEPPAIPGVGQAGGFSLLIQDRAGNTVDYLFENAVKVMEEAKKRPEVGNIFTTFNPKVPQVYVDVDRDKVTKQGVNLGEVYTTMRAFMGGLYVNLFNRFGRVWQVYVQADGAYRVDESQLGRYYVKNNKGEPVPLSALVTSKRVYGPEFTTRFNEYRSVELTGGAAAGYSSDQVMDALEEVAQQVLPKDMGYGWYGMAYQQDVARKGIPASVIFGLSLLFVFLIMAAQYESWALPFAVLLTLPVAVLGAFMALMVRGMENNVYAQIGLVMLIGLSAKNAILIVEFAKMKYDEGAGLVDAALEGARLRLRPILMTAFAFILGTVPLAIATGAGSVSRQILGTAVIGGMLGSTLIAVFLVPVSFTMIMTLFRVRRRARGHTDGHGDMDGGGHGMAPQGGQH